MAVAPFNYPTMNKICFAVFLLVGLQVNGEERWQNDYDAALYFTCPSSQSISMITSVHHNHHEDRLWDFNCKPSFDTTPTQCFWTPYVNSFDEEFTFTCPSNHIISGMESYHENKHEDRRWKFYCCREDSYCNSNCIWTPYVNYFDEQFTWYVPHLSYLAGAASYHENKHEDRRWKYMYCARHSC